LVEPENRLGFFTAPTMLREHHREYYHTGTSSAFEAEGEYSRTYIGLGINPALKIVFGEFIVCYSLL
jgi:hypothetical protein